MGDGGRIIKGAIQAVSWTNGAERLTVHIDGVTYHMTRNEYEAYLNGRRAGAEKMRERILWKLRRQSKIYAEDGFLERSEAFDLAIGYIRALPLEG